MLPPILRRLLCAPLALVLLVLATLSLYLGLTRPAGRWRTGYRGSSGTVQAGAAAVAAGDYRGGPVKPDGVVVAPPPPDVADLAPLPDTYTAFFPGRALPQSIAKSGELAQRLHAWLNRPAESHADAEEANRRGCPLVLADELVNKDQLKGDAKYWRDVVTAEQVVMRRAELVQWLADKLEAGEEVVGTQNTGSGRGIVLTAGNKDTTRRLFVLLRALKRQKVGLPIEVFHYPDELKSEKERAELKKLGATIRAIEGVTKTEGQWKNWQIKGLALVQSSFREILYLDSDNVPLRSPAHLFEAPLYADNGRAAFWPDLNKDHPDNAVWRLVGETCSLQEWSFESGQMVIDKAGNNGLNLAALWLVAGMLDKRDFWFRMCGGDKDTFRWAFRMLNIDYGRCPRWMSALGLENSYASGRFCGHTTLQYDLVTPEGATAPLPLFVHSNLLKHLGGQVEKGRLFTHIKRMTLDSAAERTLNYAHMHVYNAPVRGLCLDLDLHAGAEAGLGPAQKAEQQAEMIPVSAVEGKVFDGFEEKWWAEGGVVGGW